MKEEEEKWIEEREREREHRTECSTLIIHKTIKTAATRCRCFTQRITLKEWIVILKQDNVGQLNTPECWTGVWVWGGSAADAGAQRLVFLCSAPEIKTPSAEEKTRMKPFSYCSNVTCVLHHWSINYDNYFIPTLFSPSAGLLISSDVSQTLNDFIDSRR